MKRFSRCALILIIITLLGAIGGYIFESATTQTVYTSTAKIIVTPGEKNEATVRATDGGLVKDFEEVFKSSTVITAAQKTAGTSEDIASYLTVRTVPNSNIVELTVSNPDQSTAKTYVDAVAKNVSKTTNIVSVESIQVLEYGTEDNIATKPDVIKNTAIITGIVAALCLIVELIIVFILNAFKNDDDSDEESEYERRFGNMISANYMLAYNHTGVPNAQLGSSGDDDEDEDEKFDRAIGVSEYKEELAKLGGEPESTKKKKKKAVKEEPKPQEDEEDSDDKPAANNVVAFDAGQSQFDYDDDEDEDIVDDTTAFESDEDEPIDDLADDEYEEDDDDADITEADDASAVSEQSNVASLADYEAAAAKESKKDKRSGKKSMRSSSEVLGIIKK